MNDLWGKICLESEQLTDALSKRLIQRYIASSRNLAEAVFKIIIIQLSDDHLSREEFEVLVNDLMVDDSTLSEIIELDLKTSFDRDFACHAYIEVLLLSRGFHALAAVRVTHVLWKQKDTFTARWLNQRISACYHIDIHPAAQIGASLVIDHCMGIVIGETAVVGDNVFLFHNVTLGGTGRSDGDRHPKVESNVVIGAGATILGNIRVGENSVVAAGAVVLTDVAPNTTVAGVPATAKGKSNKVQ